MQQCNDWSIWLAVHPAPSNQKRRCGRDRQPAHTHILYRQGGGAQTFSCASQPTSPARERERLSVNRTCTMKGVGSSKARSLATRGRCVCCILDTARPRSSFTHRKIESDATGSRCCAVLDCAVLCCAEMTHGTAAALPSARERASFYTILTIQQASK